MAQEAILKHAHGEVKYLSAAAALSASEVRQLPDGRAGVVAGLEAVDAGAGYTVQTSGVFRFPKDTSTVLLPGQEAWWDETNGEVCHQASSTRSYKLGLVAEEDTVAAATTTVRVDLNRVGNYTIGGPAEGGFDMSLTLTAGVPVAVGEAGSIKLAFDTTAEAQRAEALSYNSIPVSGDGIFEFEFNVATAGDAAAVDINLGIANAGHASDADSITESVFIHIDGASTNILAESDDGTTEVGATDTTVDFTAGTRVFVQIDTRTPGDVQIYINGALVLSATTFNVAAATGPFKMLFHIEKSSDDSPGEVQIFKARGYKSPSA